MKAYAAVLQGEGIRGGLLLGTEARTPDGKGTVHRPAAADGNALGKGLQRIQPLGGGFEQVARRMGQGAQLALLLHVAQVQLHGKIVHQVQLYQELQ